MGVEDDLFICLVGDVTEFIEDLLVNVFLLGEGLRQEGEVLFDIDLSGIEKLLHNAHELHYFFGDDFQSSSSIGACKHFDIAVDEFLYFFGCVEGEAEIVFVGKDVEDVVFVDAENAEKVGF